MTEAAGHSPARQRRGGGSWERSLRPRPKPTRRRPVEPPSGWEASLWAATAPRHSPEQDSPLRTRTNLAVERTVVGGKIPTAKALTSSSICSGSSSRRSAVGESGGLDATVRVSRTVRVSPPPHQQGRSPSPPVSYLITTIAKEGASSFRSGASTSSFRAEPSDASSSTPWLKEEVLKQQQHDAQQQHEQQQQTFVGAATAQPKPPNYSGAVEVGAPDASFPLSLLRSRRDSTGARPLVAEQSVSFAPSSPQRSAADDSRSTAAVPAAAADPAAVASPAVAVPIGSPESVRVAPENQVVQARSSQPSAGQLRRQQRFGKGLRRGGPDKGPPRVVESPSDDRAPLPPFDRAPIERRCVSGHLCTAFLCTATATDVWLNLPQVAARWGIDFLLVFHRFSIDFPLKQMIHTPSTQVMVLRWTVRKQV